MELIEILAAIVGGAAVTTGATPAGRRWIRGAARLVTLLNTELRPNAGASLKDGVEELRQDVKLIHEKLDRHIENHWMSGRKRGT